MRSTFAGLNTMVRGIFSNQLSLDTTGHNITNANTEGYSRQAVNLAATRGQYVSSIYGQVLVGTGVDSTSIQRARNIYADKQYWQETATQEYYKTLQTNYDKVEAVFDDSDSTGIKNAVTEFFDAWTDLSANASTISNRTAVVEKSNVLADRIQTVATQLQDQITSQYENMALDVGKINEYTEEIVTLNKQIMTAESTGATANDLRDQRDLVVDTLSKYMNLNVYEDDNGMYSVVSNGITMVGGVNRLTLEMSDAINNSKYGISDYNVIIKESGIAFLPTNGSLKAQADTIAEDKEYIDYLSNMAAFMLTTFNTMHQQGAGIDGTDSSFGTDDGTDSYKGPTYGINFWGDSNTVYTWDADNECVVATELSDITRKAEVVNKTNADGTEVKDTDGNVIKTSKVTISGTTVTTDNLEGMEIINALGVNADITATNGQNLIAARRLEVEQEVDDNGAYVADSYKVVVNGSGDGTNATNVAAIINMTQDVLLAEEGEDDTILDSETSTVTSYVAYEASGSTLMDTENKKSTTLPNNLTNRSIDKTSLNGYYTKAMAQLGSDSESVDDKEDAQEDLITQIVNWRSSTSGVDWNEELTNMIKFQQGYSSCARCLTTMDEMLDRLINSTGVVGR